MKPRPHVLAQMVCYAESLSLHIYCIRLELEAGHASLLPSTTATTTITITGWRPAGCVTSGAEANVALPHVCLQPQ
eukprot:scaffold184244_cov19-Tisochrysis_lutea.AAC.2